MEMRRALIECTSFSAMGTTTISTPASPAGSKHEHKQNGSVTPQQQHKSTTASPPGALSVHIDTAQAVPQALIQSRVVHIDTALAVPQALIQSTVCCRQVPHLLPACQAQPQQHHKHATAHCHYRNVLQLTQLAALAPAASRALQQPAAIPGRRGHSPYFPGTGWPATRLAELHTSSVSAT